MPSKIDLSEDSKVSLPAKNLIAILAAVAIGTFSYFNLLERLTLVETELQLITKDLEAANDFIDEFQKAIWLVLKYKSCLCWWSFFQKM